MASGVAATRSKKLPFTNWLNWLELWVFSLGWRFWLRLRARQNRRDGNSHDALREFVNSIMSDMFMTAFLNCVEQCILEPPLLVCSIGVCVPCPRMLDSDVHPWLISAFIILQCLIGRMIMVLSPMLTCVATCSNRTPGRSSTLSLHLHSTSFSIMPTSPHMRQLPTSTSSSGCENVIC